MEAFAIGQLIQEFKKGSLGRRQDQFPSPLSPGLSDEIGCQGISGVDRVIGKRRSGAGRSRGAVKEPLTVMVGKSNAQWQLM